MKKINFQNVAILFCKMIKHNTSMPARAIFFNKINTHNNNNKNNKQIKTVRTKLKKLIFKMWQFYFANDQALRQHVCSSYIFNKINTHNNHNKNNKQTKTV